MNVISVKGGKVHSAMQGMGDHPYPLCRGGGMNNTLTKFGFTEAPISCKTCLTYAERTKAAAQTEEAQNEHTTYGESEPMADTKTTDHNGTIDQIEANIERAASLVEAGNPDALAELSEETEALISSLPSRGKVADKTAAKTKQDFRAAFRTAATAQTKEEPRTEVVAREVRDYATFEGVNELVTLGAQKVTEGVKLHLKTSTTAREVAAVILDMRRRIEDKDGYPDLKGASHAAKQAARAMYRAAGEQLEGDAYDVDMAVTKLIKSTQNVMSDVRAEYLRGLDDSPEEAAHFAAITKDMPEGAKVSETVAAHYGFGLVGQFELARRAYHERKALEAARARGEEPADAEEGAESANRAASTTQRVTSFVDRLVTGIRSTKPEDLQALSDEEKDEVRERLEEAHKALRALIAAAV